MTTSSGVLIMTGTTSMIEWREFNSPECASGLAGGRKVLEVKRGRYGSDMFVVSMFGSVVTERSTFDGAKAKAEGLFEEWISCIRSKKSRRNPEGVVRDSRTGSGNL